MAKLSNYVARHMQAGLNSLGQFSRSPISSFMMCLVIGITLALPTALYVVLKNVAQAQPNFQQTAQLTLYLKQNISETQAKNLAQRLKTQNNIAKTYAISPQQALLELEQQAGFQGVTSELQDNPLPWTIVVIPTISSHSFDQLAQTLKQLPEVDVAQIDMLWVKRLASMISVANRTVLALGILLSIAVLLIINNSIRSATQHNQKEIEVIQLIGGTDSFIRRPFLYAGMIYGLIGGIIAWQLVDLLLVIVRTPMHHLANLYNNSYQLIGLGFTETFILLAFSMILGFIGSWAAVTRYLKKY